MENRRCPRCGEEKPISDFLLNKSTGYYRAYCKKCRCEYSMERYNRTRKVRQGVYTDENGRKMIRDGEKNSIYWDGNMISILKRYYADTPNLEIIELLGIHICLSSLVRKAHSLGLHKSKEYLHRHNVEMSMISRAKNRKRK